MLWGAYPPQVPSSASRRIRKPGRTDTEPLSRLAATQGKRTATATAESVRRSAAPPKPISSSTMNAATGIRCVRCLSLVRGEVSPRKQAMPLKYGQNLHALRADAVYDPIVPDNELPQ